MATVVVQCKYPNGLVLQLRNSNKLVTVKGYLNATIVENGFGLTSGVDAEFWTQWYSENKNYPICTNGLISAQGSIDKSVKEAQKNNGVKSGLEQQQAPQEKTV